MASQIPPGPNVPIPNGPFYYPQTNNLSTPQGYLIVGSGLFINNITGTISAGGSGGGGITTILPGSGIFVSANVGGIVTVTNTGVLSLIAGTGISLTPGLNGSFTITNTLPATSVSGTVTSVGTGTGLTGGPITTSGTIALSNTTVTAGRYTNATIEVDAQGRITYATTGAGGSSLLATPPVQITGSTPQVISVLNASTASAGVVQLNSSTSSSSTSQAATPSAVKAANDLAFSASSAASVALSAANSACSTANTALTTATNALIASTNAIPRTSFTVKGQILAATGPGSFTVLNPGGVGQVLTVCAACTSGVYWSTPSNATGTVTQVSTGVGLTGGPITTTGTIALAPTAVTPGSYSSANLTVDAYGRILAAANGSSGSVTAVTGSAPISSSGGTTPAISISAATTTTCGAVQLATFAEVTAGVNITKAVTPNTLASVYMPRTGGTFTGPVTFASTLTANGTSCFAGNTTTTGTVTNCGAVNNCSTVTTAGATTNVGPVTNCGNTITCGTITNVGAVTNCALVTNCGNTITCGTSTFCNTATFNCSATFCSPVTFCTTPTLPAGVALGCAACVTYSNTTSGLAATNVQAAIDQVNAKTAIPATTTTLGVVCVGSNIGVTAGGLISVASSSTSQTGVVQLYNDVDSTSTTCALTAAQGKNLQDQITSLAVTGTVELAGTLDASTGLMASVTSVGSSAGYTVGSVLPAASATTVNSYAIVTSPGTVTPPGGSAIAATRGDWFLVSETTPGVYAWTFLNVGFDAPVATTAVPGIVQLATNVQAQTGTDTANAVTSSALQSKVSDSVSTTSSTTIASSTAVKSAYDLANAAIPKTALTAKGALVSASAANVVSTLSVGSDGQMLVVCSTAASGLCWINQPATAIPCSTITGKGSIVAGSAASTPTALTVGTDGQILVACAAATSGLCWITQASATIPCSVLSSVGALITTSTPNTPVALTVGTDGTILTACSAAATGLCWAAAPSPAIPCSTITGKGAIVTGTASATPSALGVGTDGQVLVACSTASTGLCWISNSGSSAIPCACVTGKGAIVTGTAASTPTALAVGTDGQVLVADSTCSSGLKWTAITQCTGTVTSVAAGTGLTGGTITGTGTIALNTTCVIQPSIIGAKGSIITGTAASTPASLAVGTAGQVLVVDSTCTSGLKWATITQCTGTVTSVAAGTGLTGGTITGTGTIALNTACVIQPTVIAAKGDIITGTGTGTPTALSVGTDGQVLVACSSTATGLAWGSGAATPLVLGTVLGCTTTANYSTALGFCALRCTTASGFFNVAVGSCSMWSNTTGGGNVAIGYQAATYGSTADFCCNVFLGQLSGHFAGCLGTTVTDNTAVGLRSLMCLTGGGRCNVAIGRSAGENQTLGDRNVLVGPNVSALNTTGSCQLAIGFANGSNWLTGDSSKNIRPGAGIVDCTGSTGASGQVLCSTGTAIRWTSSPKQYMSAYGGTCQAIPTTAFSARISNWCSYTNNGISLTAGAGAFALSENKTYLINATITPSLNPSSTVWGVYRIDTGAMVSPITAQSIAVCSPAFSASESNMSFIYTPPVDLDVAVCIGPGGNVTFFAGDNTLTITEL